MSHATSGMRFAEVPAPTRVPRLAERFHWARSMSATLVILALLAAPEAPPLADPVEQSSPQLGDDLVRLKSGGRIRGEVVESVPDSHVTVLVLGEQRTIAWSELDGIEEGHFSETKPAPEAAPEPSVPDTKGAPFVTLRSTGRRPLQLQQVEREGMGTGYGYGGIYSFSMMQWKSVCSQPCERRIDAREGQMFVVGDSPVTFSKRIALDQAQGDVVIEGRPGSKAARVLGAVGLGLGLGIALSSPIMFLLDDNQVAGFAIMLGTGSALTVAGTFGLVYGRARVKVRPMQRQR
jgi:hypothetical protein